MKKLTAILKGCKLVDNLFGLREKEILRKLEAAKDECEEKRILAEIDYEKAMKELGGSGEVNYKVVLNKMIAAKQTIIESIDTLMIIKEIEEDLNKEAELEPETGKE